MKHVPYMHIAWNQIEPLEPKNNLFMKKEMQLFIVQLVYCSLIVHYATMPKHQTSTHWKTGLAPLIHFAIHFTQDKNNPMNQSCVNL